MTNNINLTPLKVGFSPLQALYDIGTLKYREMLFAGFMLCTMMILCLHWKSGPVEIIASLTGVMCVFMVNMRKISNYLYGTINALLYGYLSYDAALYGDMSLNWLFFLPMQFVGLWSWDKIMNRGTFGMQTTVKTYKLDVLDSLNLTFITFGVYAVISTCILFSGGSQPLVDGATTTLSILATYLMIKGFREQWLVWIGVNILSIIMWWFNYQETGTGLAVLLMWSMFLINSVYGAIKWWKTEN